MCTSARTNLRVSLFCGIQLILTSADEELIKYGWDEDVWFHADNLSSAHIYLRMPEGQDWESIDKALLIDCAQLTKANSIEGMCVDLWSLQGAH